MDDIERRRAPAARLREARRLSGLSQGQVAKRKVSAEELSRFAALYDVSVTYLTGDAPDSMSLDDPRLQLAARELQRLPAESLDKLLQALAAFRTDDKTS